MAKIFDTLDGLNAVDRANAIAAEIVKIGGLPRVNIGTFDVQVLGMSAIDKGFEILVKAWQGVNPVGFGDGTVEIERIRIFYPQITVEDPTGDIIRVINSAATGEKTTRAKEDPIAWLKQDVAHTLKVIAKDGTNIIPGKIGNTTSTFNPVSGASSPVDGFCFNSVAGTSQADWDTCHDAAASSSADSTAADDWFATTRQRVASGDTRIVRGAFLFDTSAIPDTDTISSATFSVYITAKQNGDNDGNDFVSVVSATLASSAAVDTADFDVIGDAINNPTEMHDTGERKDITGVSTAAYLDWTLNATGMASITKTGITHFGTREGHDILDDRPSDGDYNYLQGRFADDVNGTPPKLVVEHAGSASVFHRIALLGVG